MPRLLVRDLDESVHQWLRERSARHNRSMESEVRAILSTARSTEVEDPVGRILTEMAGGGTEPVEVPDQFEHEHADFQ
ncbi:FitA-like ribbon-helix-helix domain-containing protein [Nesterenkonia alba]|uniref:FitA-like ribbon-helix-helix domain-containing protein n=1 Tax=Nesterenkonia alba TaxID=515814 RepID=UPI0003B44D6E|nr:plasmid stabilization protein [Nesterenkonia alba]